MNELKKLETTGYSSKLDEIAKNDTEVFLKVKLSGRRTFGEYEFEPKNVFAVDFGNHMNVLDLDKCDVYQLDQPQLNENQQIVLDYLKEITIEDVSPMRAMEFLKYELKPNEYGGFQASTVGEAFYKLNNKEEAQVLKVFSQWALEQEEE